MWIVGAGMAGLLAGKLLQRRHCPVTFERQSDLPNNHHAVLRFRSAAVGEAVGIPFKQVSLIKDVVTWRNPVADALAYAKKNGGVYRSDRSIKNGFVSEPRFVAPPNFIERLAVAQDIHYSQKFEFGKNKGTDEMAVISTIPMPDLIKQLEYKDSNLKFVYQEGCVMRAEITGCDAYVSLIVPSPEFPFSRVSITGAELIVECPLPADHFPDVPDYIISKAAIMLGINISDIKNVTGPHPQRYNKINPTDDESRKQFIWWATDQHNVYSLGRFATWRPGLLMDDLLKDINHIDQWITRRDRYGVALHRS